MLDLLIASLQRDCGILANDEPSIEEGIRYPRTEMEELQAVLITCTLLLWKGNKEQQQQARNIYTALAAHARRLNILDLFDDPASLSSFYQIRFDRNTLISSKESETFGINRN
jgi:hypothetical protein